MNESLFEIALIVHFCTIYKLFISLLACLQICSYVLHLIKNFTPQRRMKTESESFDCLFVERRETRSFGI